MLHSSPSFQSFSSLPKQDLRVVFIQAKHCLKIKYIGFRCSTFFVCHYFMLQSEHKSFSPTSQLAQLPFPLFGLLACFRISHPLTIVLGASTDVRSNSYARRRKDERKKIEDERKGNRRVTLLTSITCQFTAVAP